MTGAAPQSPAAAEGLEAILLDLEKRSNLSRGDVMSQAIRFAHQRCDEFLAFLNSQRSADSPDQTWRMTLPGWLNVNVFLALMFCLGMVLSLIVLLVQR